MTREELEARVRELERALKDMTGRYALLCMKHGEMPEEDGLAHHKATMMVKDVRI